MSLSRPERDSERMDGGDDPDYVIYTSCIKKMNFKLWPNVSESRKYVHKYILNVLLSLLLKLIDKLAGGA